MSSDTGKWEIFMVLACAGLLGFQLGSHRQYTCPGGGRTLRLHINPRNDIRLLLKSDVASLRPNNPILNTR